MRPLLYTSIGAMNTVLLIGYGSHENISPVDIGTLLVLRST